MEKTKSIRNLEERMEGLEPGSLRHRVLSSAKDFKSSWIELGQVLFIVYKEKKFKDWGYLTFEAYCQKEVGIRQATGLKLLRSYSFLEHEEPVYLKKLSQNDPAPSQIPSYESVNSLRLVKTSERIPEKDYEKLREDVLDHAGEETQVKKKVRYLLQTYPARRLEDGESLIKRKETAVKRILTQLRAAKTELGELKFPTAVLKEMDALIARLEDYQS